VNRYEKQKAAIERAIAEKITEYQAVYAKADEEDREPSQDERLDIEGCLKRIEILKKERSEADANIDQMRRVEELGRDLGPAIPGNTSGGGVSMRVESEPQDRVFRSAQKSLGDAFIESKGYKDAINDYRSSGGRFREGFSTGAVTLDMKGTLLEGAAGGGGALAATVPQVIPGAVETLFQKLTFADLVLGGQASTNSVRYVVEGTATSGAAGVAEGGTKPESTVGLTTTDEPIKKIATLLPVSEEMLEDAPAIQSYINGRLSLFVRIEEERQLLRGTSGGNEVQGMLTTRNVPVFGTASAAAGDDFATKIFKAANSMRGSAFVEPEWVVMHPSDWQTIRLAKDGAGGFASTPESTALDRGRSRKIPGWLAAWWPPVYPAVAGGCRLRFDMRFVPDSTGNHHPSPGDGPQGSTIRRTDGFYVFQGTDRHGRYVCCACCACRCCWPCRSGSGWSGQRVREGSFERQPDHVAAERFGSDRRGGVRRRRQRSERAVGQGRCELSGEVERVPVRVGFASLIL
jgi:HK97 family phage major capsid protein